MAMMNNNQTNEDENRYITQHTHTLVFNNRHCFLELLKFGRSLPARKPWRRRSFHPPNRVKAL